MDESEISALGGITPPEQEFYQQFHKIQLQDTTITPEMITSIRHLSADTELLSHVESSARSIFDTYYLPYFFPEIQRIAKSDYIPTETDIVMATKPCPRILKGCEVVLKHDRLDVHFVTPPRSVERKRWIHMLDDRTEPMIIADMAAYDHDIEFQFIEEFMVLVDSVIQSPCFQQRPVIVLLGHIDVMKDKLTVSPFNEYCSGYTGDNGFDSVMEYIIQRLKKFERGKSKIYPYQVESLTSVNWSSILNDIPRK